MAHPIDPIIHRTLFYEQRTKDGSTLFQFHPFYLVTIAGGPGGKIFEPVDCMKRQNPTSVFYGYKEINKITEFDGKARMFNCEQVPETQLHKFQSWEWPVT